MLNLYREVGQQIDFYKRPDLDKIFKIKVEALTNQSVVVSTENFITGEKENYTIRRGSSIKLHDSIHLTVKQLLKSTAIFNFIIDDDIKVLRSELKLFR